MAKIAINKYYMETAKKFCLSHPSKKIVIEACNVEGCKRPIFVFTFCNKHYQEWIRYGEIKSAYSPEDIDGEEWRDVVGLEGVYLVSNYGRVKRKTDYTYRKNSRMSVRTKILKPDRDKKGYCRVHLSNKGVMKTFLIHRLVAEAFLPNENNFPQVNHIDGNPSNNTLENLEWCDQSYQEIHKHYVLGHCGGTYEARKVINKTSGEIYPSIGSASRSSGVPIHILFNRLQSGKKDPNGNTWEYIV